jgi:hypothetical protein
MDTSKEKEQATPAISIKKESPAEAALFRCLGNPIRRQILRFMLACGICSYSTLRDTFQLEPGTLYFHLEQLMTEEAPLLQQTADRQYQITDLGRVAANFLNQADDLTPSTAPPSPTAAYPRLRRVGRILGFVPVFRYLTHRVDHLLIEAIMLVIGLAVLVTLMPTLTIGFLSTPLPVITPLLSVTTFLGSWFLAALGTQLIVWVRDHKTEGFPALLSASLYAWLPLGLLVILSFLFDPIMTASMPLAGITIFLTLIWSTWIYIQAIVHTKRIELRKACLITVIILSISLFLTFITAP